MFIGRYLLENLAHLEKPISEEDIDFSLSTISNVEISKEKVSTFSFTTDEFLD